MEILEKTEGRKLLLEFYGELDHHAARDVLHRMEVAMDTSAPTSLTLDLGGLSFMDSSGIAIILRARQRMRLLDGTVLVRSVPPQALRVLLAAGIDKLVPVEPKET